MLPADSEKRISCFLDPFLPMEGLQSMRLNGQNIHLRGVQPSLPVRARQHISQKGTEKGVQYLIDKRDAQPDLKYRTATLEEILLFFMRGDTKCED